MSESRTAHQIYMLSDAEREKDAIERSLASTAAPEGFQGAGDPFLTEAVWRLVAAQERSNSLLAELRRTLGGRK